MKNKCHFTGRNQFQAYTIEPLAPAVQLAMVYGGGSIQYFGGHPLPQLTVTLWRTTTYGELWKELKNQLACIGESFDQYKDSEIKEAVDYFYQENIKGRTSKAFAKFSREERAGMEESGEGSAYVFVFLKTSLNRQP